MTPAQTQFVKTKLEVLKTARQLLENPDNWTKGALNRPRQLFGNSADWQNRPNEFRMCSIGAVDAALGAPKDYTGSDFRGSEVKAAERYNTERHRVFGDVQHILDKCARRRVNPTSNYGVKFANVVALNDNKATTHADVLAVFDEAIAEVKQGE